MKRCPLRFSYIFRKLGLWKGGCLFVCFYLGVFVFVWSDACGRFADSAYADPPSIALDDPSQAWQIEADRINYDKVNGTLISIGNVTIAKNLKQMKADRIVFDNNNRVVNAYGHVVFTSGEDMMTGERIELDLDSETGTVYKGTAFMSDGHFYIKGDRIRKIGRNTYDAENASISTCDAENPDWKINGRDVQVTIDGFGRVKHASLWAGDIPLLYTPYFSFPAKVNRQTGFLSPYPAVSKRKGIEYNQPFYWAINKSSDATFFYHHMQYRGEKFGLEYRYVTCPQIKGMVMIDGFNDRKTDTSALSSDDKWGYEDEGEDFERPNKERYWIRAKQDLNLPYQISAKLDLDVVSDQDYLYEFKDDYSGFEYSDDAFGNFFGRDLDDYDDTTRINRFNLNKTTNAFSINTEARWYDNVINLPPGESDTSRHKLPSVSIESLKQKIDPLPLYYNIDTEYTRFYRRDALYEFGTDENMILEGDIKKGQRTDLYGRLYLPFGFGNYCSLEPSFGFRRTNWFLKEADTSQKGYENNNLVRDMYDFNLDFFSELERVYNYQGTSVDRVRHSIRPEVGYQYLYDMDQEEYPEFDSFDDIEQQNIVTYSLIQTWTLRSKRLNENGNSLKLSHSDLFYRPNFKYDRLCRFKIEQSYDFKKDREDDPEPFSDIGFEFDIFPVSTIWIDADARLSQYQKRFTAHNIGVGWVDGKGNEVKIEHRYFRDFSESIYSKVELAATSRIQAYVEYERNIQDHTDILLACGFNFSKQCWGIGFHYKKDQEDWKVFGTVTLTGISGFTIPNVHLD